MNISRYEYSTLAPQIILDHLHLLAIIKNFDNISLIDYFAEKLPQYSFENLQLLCKLILDDWKELLFYQMYILVFTISNPKQFQYFSHLLLTNALLNMLVGHV